jgi:hypothetical protein
LNFIYYNEFQIENEICHFCSFQSIPHRGVVAISPLFHFQRWEIFAFALVGDIYPSSENDYDENDSRHIVLRIWELKTE